MDYKDVFLSLNKYIFSVWVSSFNNKFITIKEIDEAINALGKLVDINL